MVSTRNPPTSPLRDALRVTVAPGPARRSTVLWVAGMALAVSSLPGCAGLGQSRLDALRAGQPSAVVDARGAYQDVAACLTDRVLRAELQAVPNIHPAEGRATVTAYSSGGVRRPVTTLRLEYEVIATDASTSRVVLRRFSGVFDRGDTTPELRAALGACGFPTAGGPGPIAG